MDHSIRNWLLAGDPAIRWQVLRTRREQRRVAKEGWGAQLLQLQDPDGRWAQAFASMRARTYNKPYARVTGRVLCRQVGSSSAVQGSRLSSSNGSRPTLRQTTSGDSSRFLGPYLGRAAVSPLSIC
ncbi:hypothetical protein SBA4_3030031 [Candidatus Sulfopaludibacter sp. SbA4]|nr:hypothetical protein SBA4_3030031 [Candidatus Sulfopaludibacter sp. SbA4]